jgi:tetratricopeptide (TPR) repeat protein
VPATIGLIFIAALAGTPAGACGIAAFAEAAAADGIAHFQESIAAADASLRRGDLTEAQARYRAALAEGWTLVGRFAEQDGRLPAARDAFSRAAALGAAPAPGSTAMMAEARSRETEGQVRALVAGAHFNLGVLQTQSKAFDAAAAEFEAAIAADATFPRANAALGIACFNAGQFERARDALTHALQTEPNDASLRRMLALSAFQLEDWPQAASLLAQDEVRSSDPSLQFAYGVALVRSGQADQAEAVFSKLLVTESNSAELNVVLGLAQAQQGDFDAAVGSLQRALRVNAQVPQANATLGIIAMKRGQLAEAERSLRAELAIQPRDVNTRHVLATVLDLEGRSPEALTELQSVLAAKPAFADAQYLAGKILVAEGDTADGVEHLEVAARLAPGEANIHYQLAQAYRKAGESQRAAHELETYRALKEKRRGDPR